MLVCSISTVGAGTSIMAASLLPLSGGALSLELDEDDLDAVSAYIAAHFSKGGKTVYPTLTVYNFGGCDFVFQNEWGDPCLIADSEEGRAILVRIHEHLNRKE
jgi:hypothetical protein